MRASCPFIFSPKYNLRNAFGRGISCSGFVLMNSKMKSKLSNCFVSMMASRTMAVVSQLQVMPLLSMSCITVKIRSNYNQPTTTAIWLLVIDPRQQQTIMTTTTTRNSNSNSANRQTDRRTSWVCYIDISIYNLRNQYNTHNTHNTNSQLYYRRRMGQRDAPQQRVVRMHRHG